MITVALNTASNDLRSHAGQATSFVTDSAPQLHSISWAHLRHKCGVSQVLFILLGRALMAFPCDYESRIHSHTSISRRIKLNASWSFLEMQNFVAGAACLNHLLAPICSNIASPGTDPFLRASFRVNQQVSMRHLTNGKFRSTRSITSTLESGEEANISPPRGLN
jgi:hypothetical protein